MSAIDKGKSSLKIQYEERPQQQQQQQYQKPVQKREYKHSFTELMNKEYPFKEEAVRKIFKNLLKKPDFQLPEAKFPEEMNKSSDTNFCPYHRRLGHPIEKCFTFKEWLDKSFKAGTILIPKE
ncbi:hypothetical protein, partial [Klebsiella pneumoniae]|uniref:hypothetical protein n=1 Tax=Klebsiella pneumoniae TaxID=573 RepID=UPI00137307F6